MTSEAMTSKATNSETGPTPGKMVGQRIKRTEDPALIQGLGTFVDDIKLPGMLHIAFRRSDVAHGRITRIDTTAAEALPGVELIMTGAQLRDVVPPQPILTPFPHPDSRRSRMASPRLTC